MIGYYPFNFGYIHNRINSNFNDLVGFEERIVVYISKLCFIMKKEILANYDSR